MTGAVERIPAPAAPPPAGPARTPATDHRRLSPLIVSVLFAATLVQIGVSRQVGLTLAWVGVWVFAWRYGWRTTASFPLLFYVGYVSFYPQAAVGQFTFQERATMDAVVFAGLAAATLPQAAALLRRTQWFRYLAGLWLVWGVIAYAPVFIRWLFPEANTTAALGFETTGLKTAAPVILAVGVAAAAAAGLRTVHDVQRLTQAMLVALWWITIPAFIQAAGVPLVPTEYISQVGRLVSVTTPDANAYGRLLLLPLIVLLAPLLAIDRARARARGLWLGLFVGMGSLVLTQSRTSLASFAIGAMVLVLLNRHQRRTAWVFGMLFAITFSLGLALGALAQFDLDDRRSLQNLETRLELYETAVDMIRDHPWVGVGPGAFVPESEYRAQLGNASLQANSAHNLLLGVAAEWGIPMAILVVLVNVGALWNSLLALRALRRIPAGSGRGAIRGLISAVAALAVAYGVQGLTETMPLNYLFFIFGLSIACRFVVVPRLQADTQGVGPDPTARFGRAVPRAALRRGVVLPLGSQGTTTRT